MATKPELVSSDSPKGMTPIVKTVVRFAMGIVFMFGWYIIIYGHLTPGGGFAGGTILACGYVLLTLAFGKEVSLAKMSDKAASIIDNSARSSSSSTGDRGDRVRVFLPEFSAARQTVRSRERRRDPAVQHPHRAQGDLLALRDIPRALDIRQVHFEARGRGGRGRIGKGVSAR